MRLLDENFDDVAICGWEDCGVEDGVVGSHVNHVVVHLNVLRAGHDEE